MIWNRFQRSEKGLALIFVTITLPAIIGFSLLAIDGARVYNLHNDLQKAADAFALTAAAELDGLPDQKIRAQRAVKDLVDNFSRFSTSGTFTLTDADIAPLRFLKEIPANDDIMDAMGRVPAGAPYDSLTDTDAPFVEVTVNPTDLNTIFPASFLGGSDIATLDATAVAGFTSGVCDFTPIYICNPYEGALGGPGDPTLFEAATLRSERRKMIELRQQGGNACQNGPGNYGFLENPLGNGAPALRNALAMANPPICYSSRGVEVSTGFIATVRDALGVRFDMYNGPMGGKKNDPLFRPAKSVRKGFDPGASACNQIEVPPPDPDDITTRQYMGLPRDNNMLHNNCADGRIGDGHWDFMKYMKVNHGDVVAAGATSYTNRDGVVWTDWPPGPGEIHPTRYEVYLEELYADPSIIDNPSGQHAMSGGLPDPPARPEIGSPACYSGGAGSLSNDPDRRLLYGAILDCVTYAADLVGGSGNEIPVTAFVSFFLIEPVESSGGNQNIRVELVDITGQGGQGTLETFSRDDVQLYR